MKPSIYIAASGALANQFRMEILANNLSNLDTVGFKKDQAILRGITPFNLLSENLYIAPRFQSQSPFIVYAPTLVVLDGTTSDFSPGQLKATNNSLDLALDGPGFFSVETPEGIRYTRKGNFTLNQKGEIVTEEGFPLLGEGGKIKVGGGEVAINSKGEVIINGSPVDRIKVVDFPRPYRLKKQGNSLFVLLNSKIKEKPAEGVEVKQGYLETSNVDPVDTLVRMIEVLRTYESFQKLIQATDESMAKAINEVGKTR